MVCLVHAALPFMFEKTASNAVTRLHDRMVVNRARPQLYARTPRDRLEVLLETPPKRLSRGARGLLDAVRIGLDRGDVAAAIDARLTHALAPGTPILHVPDLPGGGDLVEQVGAALRDELSLPLERTQPA